MADQEYPGPEEEIQGDPGQQEGVSAFRAGSGGQQKENLQQGEDEGGGGATMTQSARRGEA